MDGVHTLQQQLVEQKNKIIESIDLHKRLVSPLWRLPTEVLSQIFCHCLLQIPELGELEPPSKLTVPMSLTRICRRWREVVVDMPNLWRVLSVKVDDRNWQQVAFSYDSWLKRAQGRPLWLRLQFHADDDSTKLQCLLQPYTNQIKSLSVDFYRLGTLKPNMFKGLLALEEISMYFEEDIHACEMPSYIVDSIISGLPSTLRSFDVSGWALDFYDLSSCDPVWTHLTTLGITVWQVKALLRLLQLAPNLSSLTIRIILFHSILRALQPFTHANLQTLHIRVSYDCDDDEETLDFCNLLDALSLPTLRVLTVHGVPEWPHEKFKAFLARSECSLESLIVSGSVVTDEQQAEYVALVPSFQFVPYPAPFITGFAI
ncbi:hypothetical protein DFJ58DRAFT_784507 [Suillus subalutaceus]|uniref:uncharacterized protein n=1 Tax=Suillus subalutaceus TaxID=48586 RepID=UPI001B860A89|nr:uncharacterized protein DFJ58DRAFT_784507 [Suillus subalutaceus]KAG1856706.1 hypothetical protein DFJ58DRAFT_784507 [Suillus subalutaceus]